METTTQTPLSPMDDKLLAALRRCNPYRVLAFNGDDDAARDIAVPQRRRRWVQVIKNINSRAWSRVELVDKKGAILDYVENTAPASEVEDIAHGAKWGGEHQLAVKMVDLALGAMKTGMAYRDAEVQNLLKAQGDVVRELSQSMRALSEVWQDRVQAERELADTQAQKQLAESVEPDMMKQVMEALPAIGQIAQMLPMLKSMLGGDAKPATPPNGARKG